MASTGIIQRRNTKKVLTSDEYLPVTGEIVYAYDTDEFGVRMFKRKSDGQENALIADQELDKSSGNTEVIYKWRKFDDLVKSVNGMTEDVKITPENLGLGKVANKTPAEIIAPALGVIDGHIDNKNNPHNVTKEQLGLGSVENTPDEEKPLSIPQRNYLDEHYFSRDEIRKIIDYEEGVSDLDSVLIDKLSKSNLIDGNKKLLISFKKLEIKDGELSEYNFHAEAHEKVEELPRHPLQQMISDLSDVLTAQVDTAKNKVLLTLKRGDGSTETLLLPNLNENYDAEIETINDNIKTLSSQVTQFSTSLNLAMNSLKVIDNLNSQETTTALSANQGRILNEKIKSIETNTTTQGTGYSNLKEVINAMRTAVADVESMNNTITSINLTLQQKVTGLTSDPTGTAPNSQKLNGQLASYYTTKSEHETLAKSVETNKNNITKKLNISDLETNVKTIVNKNWSLDKIKEHETDITNLEADIDRIDTSLNKHNSSINTNKSNISTLQSKASTFENQISTINNTLSSKANTSVTNNLSTRLSALESSIGDTTQRDSILNRIDTAEDDVEDLQDRVTKLEASVATIQSTLSSLQTQVNSHDTTINNHETRIKKLEN